MSLEWHQNGVTSQKRFGNHWSCVKPVSAFTDRQFLTTHMFIIHIFPGLLLLCAVLPSTCRNWPSGHLLCGPRNSPLDQLHLYSGLSVGFPPGFPCPSTHWPVCQCNVLAATTQIKVHQHKLSSSLQKILFIYYGESRADQLPVHHWETYRQRQPDPSQRHCFHTETLTKASLSQCVLMVLIKPVLCINWKLSFKCNILTFQYQHAVIWSRFTGEKGKHHTEVGVLQLQPQRAAHLPPQRQLIVSVTWQSHGYNVQIQVTWEQQGQVHKRLAKHLKVTLQMQPKMHISSPVWTLTTENDFTVCLNRMSKSSSQ